MDEIESIDTIGDLLEFVKNNETHTDTITLTIKRRATRDSMIEVLERMDANQSVNIEEWSGEGDEPEVINSIDIMPEDVRDWVEELEKKDG